MDCQIDLLIQILGITLLGHKLSHWDGGTFNLFGNPPFIEKIFDLLMVFGQNYAVLDMVGETIFPKTLIVKTKESTLRILKIPYWTSTSKSYSPSLHEIYKIIAFKDQNAFFFVSVLIVKFFTPKFMKIKCYLESLQLLEVTS